MQATEVTFPAADGTELAGTFSLPDAGAPVRAALILNGSGPLDRDSNMPGQVLGVASSLAQSLAELGVASLRFDKRGVGQSAGEYPALTFERETEDAASALDTLRGWPGVDPSRIAVVGHSVGATIAIRLAAHHGWIAGIVLLAAAASDGTEVMRLQSERIAASLRGLERLAARRFLRQQAEVRDAVLAGEGDALDVTGGLSRGWLREYMRFDPVADLRAIGCPVLAITGRKDLQVDPEDVERIGSLVAGPFAGSTPDDLTHVLRTDPGRPRLSAYASQIERPVDADLLTAVATWVAAL